MTVENGLRATSFNITTHTLPFNMDNNYIITKYHWTSRCDIARSQSWHFYWMKMKNLLPLLTSVAITLRIRI